MQSNKLLFFIWRNLNFKPVNARFNETILYVFKFTNINNKM